MDSQPKSVGGTVGLRQSANSGQRPKYNYQKSKPYQQTEKVGEYTTKEARQAKAQQIKSAHFQLSYGADAKPIQANGIEEEVNR